jgi:hypothetical protein
VQNCSAKTKLSLQVFKQAISKRGGSMNFLTAPHCFEQSRVMRGQSLPLKTKVHPLLERVMSAINPNAVAAARFANAGTPGVDLNALSGEGQRAFAALPGWKNVVGGKAQVRSIGLDSEGKTIYEIRGAKSKVTIHANSFQAAANRAAELIAFRALTPLRT